MNWKDKFNRPMELDSPEYKLATAIRALQQKIKLGIIDKEKATEIMTGLVEKECEEDKECLTTNKETLSESSTISDKSTTINSD